MSKQKPKSVVSVYRYFKISLPIIIGIGVIVGWAWSFMFAPGFAFGFTLAQNHLFSTTLTAKKRRTLKEGCTTSAASHNKFTLWLLFIASVMFVLAGVFIASTAKSSGQMLLSWSSIIFLWCCGVAIGFILKVKQHA